MHCILVGAIPPGGAPAVGAGPLEIGWKDQPPMRWAMADLLKNRIVVFNGHTVEYEALPTREAPPPR